MAWTSFPQVADDATARGSLRLCVTTPTTATSQRVSGDVKAAHQCIGIVAILMCAAVWLTPGVTTAAQGEWETSVFGGVASAKVDGLAGRLGAQLDYNVGDLWTVGALTFAETRAAALGGAALVTGRLIVDALTWVPSVAIGAGVDFRPQRQPDAVVSWLVRAQAEMAYRPGRDWGAFGRLLGELEGGSAAVGAEVGVRWYFSAAGALDY